MPRTRARLDAGEAALTAYNSTETLDAEAFRGIAHAWYRRKLGMRDPPHFRDGRYRWPIGPYSPIVGEPVKR